jgi:sec-independent protein translocase protein TatA
MSALEILIIVAIVLLLFGATRLPAVGGALGRLVRSFKLAASSRDEIEVSESDSKSKDRERLQNGEDR